MSKKEVRKKLTQKEACDLMHEILCIKCSTRQIRNWNAGINTPPGYPGLQNKHEFLRWLNERRLHRKSFYMLDACCLMYESLSDAVKKYGKPGGPWNVPGEPGTWIAKARAALRKARGEE